MDNTVDFSDLKEFIINNYNNNKYKKKRRKKLIIILINILSILLLLLGGFGLKSIFDYKNDLENTLNTKEELKELTPVFTEDEKIKEDEEEVVIENKEFNDWFNSLLSKNSDTIGWLKVKNADIDMPIVKTTDNKYYLSHNFNKERNSMGWAFADYRNSFPNLSQNTIIYGHTYKKTIIFSNLTNLLSKAWLDNTDNHIIEFTTSEKKLYFKVFSIYTIKETDDYLQTNFTYKEYKNFIDKVKKRSIRDFNVDITFNTRILTLSTCYQDSNHRLVVHASLMEE